jgi:hypothetical protein
MEPGTVAAGVGQGGVRVSVVRWLAGFHPAGLMHGAVVMGAVLALVADDEASSAAVAASAAGVLVVYWATHAYSDALGAGVGGDRVHLFRRLRRFGRRDAAVLLGGLPALAVFSVMTLLGAAFPYAVDGALWLTLLLLTAVGYLAAHVAGVTGWRLAGETAFAALVGGCIVLLNTGLH